MIGSKYVDCEGGCVRSYSGDDSHSWAVWPAESKCQGRQEPQDRAGDRPLGFRVGGILRTPGLGRVTDIQVR